MEPTWRQFLTSQADANIACDFLRINTARVEHLYALVFLEHGTRRLHIAGVTSHPTAPRLPSRPGTWPVTYIRLESLRFLI